MLAVVRQLTGLVVLASVYVFVKSLSKRIGCILVGIQFNKQSVASGNKNEVFVDLFCKVIDMIHYIYSMHYKCLQHSHSH